MGLRSKINQWFEKRIVNSVSSESLKLALGGFLKNEILNTINDEEVAKALMGYGDSFYDRYHSKLTGWLGGTTKGVNSVIRQVGNGQIENTGINNGLFDLIAGMDGKDFSIANGLKLLLMSSQSGSNGGSQSNSRNGVMS